MSEEKLAAVFLDRDGTIIREQHYPRDPNAVELLPGVIEALQTFRRKGYLIYVVSNQSGVGRGKVSESEFLAVHQKVCALLQAPDINPKIDIVEFLYCFHEPTDPCLCRKPKIGLIPKSYQGKPFDWAACATVGDKLCDLQLGDNLKTQTFLVLTGHGAETLAALGADHGYRVCASLDEVAQTLTEIC